MVFSVILGIHFTTFLKNNFKAEHVNTFLIPNYLLEKAIAEKINFCSLSF